MICSPKSRARFPRVSSSFGSQVPRSPRPALRGRGDRGPAGSAGPRAPRHGGEEAGDGRRAEGRELSLSPAARQKSVLPFNPDEEEGYP